MKFNFKKITPIIAGALLLGSTIGFAASADYTLSSYPSPFVAGGVADVAVVYGASAQTIDMASAALFTADLSKLVTTAGSSVSVSGENVKIATDSNKLNLGENLTDVRTTEIDNSDLSSLLAKKTYQSKDGVSYDYTQKVKLGGALKYSLMKDADYNNNEATLGITISANQELLNYTLSFTKTIESDVTSGKLEDIQDTDIVILGKTYRILNAYNGTSGATSTVYLELMGGAKVDTLLENANASYTISGKTYDVSVSNIAEDGAALTINGQTTPKMSAGSTYKLSDGTQVGIRTLWFQTTKVSSVEFSLGAEKLTLYANGQNVKINDVTVNDLKGYITVADGSSGKKTISDIKFQWMPTDKKFITASRSLEMPGLGALKLSMGDLTTPKTETVKVLNNGDNQIQLQAPIKDGTVTLDLLYGNGTLFKHIGSNNYNITTAANLSSTISFDRDNNQYFIASYESATAAESYVLKVVNMRNESGTPYVDIQDYWSAEKCLSKKNDDTCKIGSLVLTIDDIDTYNRNLSIDCDSSCRFDRLYTAEGLKIFLPVLSTDQNASYTGALNLSLGSFALVMSEEDKNSNLGSDANITATLGWSSNKAEVSSVSDTGFVGSKKRVEGTDDYINYMSSALGTKITFKDITQNTLEVEYHGSETYGNVYVASAGATVTGAGVGGSAVFDIAVPDTEAIPNKNLIVIGGSAVNKVSATLLGLTYPAYGAAFTEKTDVGANEAILQIAANPSYNTKFALLVAGWEGKDTKAAAKALISKSVTLGTETSVVLKTVTEATTALKP